MSFWGSDDDFGEAPVPVPVWRISYEFCRVSMKVHVSLSSWKGRAIRNNFQGMVHFTKRVDGISYLFEGFKGSGVSKKPLSFI